ncbi:DUF6610 family protein [Haloarcula marismortui]|uniref:Uncharacterized protein n=1 Tax=Haloarcula marismortui ATCC 33800 TaxID=662476 RepID=M0JNZ0_9EURY|nr:DUF6610 family protein [Haloarcula sinaiiensis]EMA10053.1 hypothetical protein C436_18581 [Haloarcula sinaiiensis ATCC 33800]QUJ74922.1 hypothetical protein KDQ40_22635 [Haloarcula sinaiiensis ATCC 33800]
MSSEARHSWSAAAVGDAQQAEYIGFLHREPFVIDAYRLGFAVGVREDYTYQSSLRNVDVPIEILDNDFRNPDLDRYIERFEQYEPSVGMLGDAYDQQEARRYNQAARELKRKFPGTEVIIVPKCRDAIDVIDEDIVLGYPMGYSDQTADEYTDIVDWRGRRVHLLGASPTKQYPVIEELTQPRVTGQEPADIVGVDWNGIHLAALHGEYFSPHGYGSADQLSIRETVQQSLRHIRSYWKSRGVWPTVKKDRTPLTAEPMDPVWAADGSTATVSGLEDAIVVEYENGQTLAYRSQHERDRVEYRAGLTPSEVHG